MISNPMDSLPEKPPKSPYCLWTKLQISALSNLASGALAISFPLITLCILSSSESRRHSFWPWRMLHSLLEGLCPAVPHQIPVPHARLSYWVTHSGKPPWAFLCESSSSAYTCARTYSVVLYVFIMKTNPSAWCGQFPRLGSITYVLRIWILESDCLCLNLPSDSGQRVTQARALYLGFSEFQFPL